MTSSQLRTHFIAHSNCSYCATPRSALQLPSLHSGRDGVRTTPTNTAVSLVTLRLCSDQYDNKRPMKTNRAVQSLDSTIEQLKGDWNQLSDPQRAQNISQIRKQYGLSIRQIARRLSCSESLLRRLLKVLRAPAQDLVLAREGKITTNELLRREKAAAHLRDQQQRKAAQQDRERQGAEGADLIYRWFIETGFNAASCWSILEDVRLKFALKEQDRTLPMHPKPVEVPVAEIIRKTEPPPRSGEIALEGWYAGWLFSWTYWAFPDREVRWTALDTVLEWLESGRN